MRDHLQPQGGDVGKSRGLPLSIEDLYGIAELPLQPLAEVPRLQEIAQAPLLLPTRDWLGLQHSPEIRISRGRAGSRGRGGFPDGPIDLDRGQGGGCAAVGVEAGQGPTEDHLPALLPGRQVHHRTGNADQRRQRLAYFPASRRQEQKEETSQAKRHST